MRRAFALLLVLALTAAGAAVAGKGDPQKRITPADQARAKAMLLRKSDVGAGFRVGPALGGSSDLYCKALDESDLTLTGEAQSPTFQGGVETVSSLSRVYRSLRDSSASWRRGTSRAGERCVRAEFGGALVAAGGTLESFGRVDFPDLAERTSAYRLVVSSQGLRAYLDVVGLKQGRAQVALLFGSALTPVPHEVEVRVARAVARRMKAAMRGA
jgi:hypothetical protein